MSKIKPLVTFLLATSMLLSIILPYPVRGEAFDYTKTREFEHLLQRVERWRPLIAEIIGTSDLDKLVVLSVIAQESSGLPSIISTDRYKSVGLMQVTPKPWTGSPAQLRHPVYNIDIGIRILNKVLREAEGNTFQALKAYNCGWARIRINPFCGDYYADKVLNFWYPLFEERWLELICEGKWCLEE